MATFKIGSKVLWLGKARTVDGERCTDQEVHELHLSWTDASGHLRRGWVAASACKAIGAPSPTAAACAVGKRGAFSQRQDVSEAAARVKARLLDNLPPKPSVTINSVHVSETMPPGTIAFVQSGKVNGVLRTETATPAPSTDAPAPGRVPCPHDTRKSDSDPCSATGPCPADSDIDCTIPAPAPSADAEWLPGGWFWDRDRNEFHHRTGCSVVNGESEPHRWMGYNPAGHNVTAPWTSHPTRSAAIAACEAWIAAQKPAHRQPCPKCAAKDAEIARLTAERDNVVRQLNLANADHDATIAARNALKAELRRPHVPTWLAVADAALAFAAGLAVAWGGAL